MRPSIAHTLEERLEWYGVRDAGQECIAPRALNHPRANGYWDVSFEGRGTYLHRLILRANVGHIEPDVQARHICGHKWCVNRSHIIPGTIADNMRDQYELGERVMNDSHPAMKLNVPDARAIRDADASVSTRDLADRYNVSIRHVRGIRSGKSRRFLDVAQQ